ncbi:MAG TPA: YHS domain-containing protein [Streptosporangiaceae bacterium]
MTDPVCGMSVDPATAEQRTLADGTVYFCSAHCAASYDAEPGRYTTPAPAARATP